MATEPDDLWRARSQLMPRAALCGPCRREWLAWLDYRLPRQRWLAPIGGNPLLLSLDGVEAGYRAWAGTIRAQQALIEEHCAAAHRPALDRDAPAA